MSADNIPTLDQIAARCDRWEAFIRDESPAVREASAHTRISGLMRVMAGLEKQSAELVERMSLNLFELSLTVDMYLGDPALRGITGNVGEMK